MDLISTIVHVYCFCLFLRILFHDPSEMFFSPFLSGIQKITDPVVLFLKKNRIMNIFINPWIPIMLLLFIKALLFRSTLELPYYISIQSAFMTSVLEFFSFLFDTCLFMFWMVYSSHKYNVYDEIFNIFAIICNKIIALVPLHKKNLSIRNEPVNCLGLILIIFFSCFMIIYTGILSFQQGRELLTLKNLSLFPFKNMLSCFIEMIYYLPILIFIKIIISWFMPPVSRIWVMLIVATEPVLEPFRRLNLVIGMLDFSPVVALIFLTTFLKLLHNLIQRI